MDINKLLKDNFICRCEEYSKVYTHINAPLFRKDFNIESFKEAKLYICGLGLYELFINGNKITKGKLAPYFSNPNHYIYYDEYDLTDILTPGGNAIGVLLGNGWLNPIGGSVWGFDKADWRASERLSLVLVIDKEVFLVSDTSFKVKQSHITFNDLRCGEYVDYRLLNKADYLYGCIDSSFTGALKTTSPLGEPKLCTAEPIVEQEARKPISITKSDGGYIYDFGENLAGVPRFKIKGHEGQKISIWAFEATLDGGFYNKNTCVPEHDRFMSQKDILICSGQEDLFEPSFTYHGFRYIFLEGSEGIPCELDMIVLSSNIANRATIETDNDIINKIQKMTINSDISNFFYFPTDCPQREKNGWTGDASLSCEQYLYNYDCSNSLSVWLDNIRKAQAKSGQIPGLIPTFEFGYSWGNGPVWDSVLFELPYNIYKFSGSNKIIVENKEAMWLYISSNLKSRINSDGLIAYGLVDWCEAGSELEYICSTPNEITDSLITIDILSKASKMFEDIGEAERASYCNEFRKEILSSFRKKYVTGSQVSIKTQTAQALAIKVGVFESNKKEAVDALVDLIHSNNDLMKYGVLGNKVIYDVLVDAGYNDLALTLITQDRFPSFFYWIKNDATSLWEAFNEVYDNKLLRKDGGRVLSLNHHFWGSVSAFFYKYIAGLIINPNLKSSNIISIKPYLFKDINHVKCSYESNGNKIIYEINKVNDKLAINIIENKGFIII